MSVECGVAVFRTVVVRSVLLGAGETLTIGSDEDVVLAVVQRGLMRVRLSSRRRVLDAGEALLARAGEHATAVMECDVELLIVTGPRELAADLGVGTAEASFIRAESILLRPAAAFAAQSVQSDAERTRLGDYYIERLLQEMLQGLFADTSAAGWEYRRVPDPYRHALSVIEAQFADAALTSNDIAEAVNLSRRQLERWFSRHGTTIRAEIRRLRIEQALKLLRDPQYFTLSVQDVARHVGFSGASSLARAMSEAGHASPSRVRRQRPVPRPTPPASR